MIDQPCPRRLLKENIIQYNLIIKMISTTPKSPLQRGGASPARPFLLISNGAGGGGCQTGFFDMCMEIIYRTSRNFGQYPREQMIYTLNSNYFGQHL